MISRRLLRIKIMQALYAFYRSDEKSVVKAEKELLFSINKTYELYHYLLLIVLDIVIYAEGRIDLAKQKRIPTQQDLNPNMRFLNNRMVKQIECNKQFNTYLNNQKLSWVNYPELIKNLFIAVLDSDCYKDYMKAGEDSYKADKELVIDIFEKVIINCEDLYLVLEEQSIYWNDDVEFVIGMIIKTLSKFKEKDRENAQLMDQYKNDEDREFSKKLFRKTLQSHDETLAMIEKNTKNWDVERIAFMDILIMQIAITEITEFNSIPTKVSFNEYLEISKFYSTSKSSLFINGILDKIINQLKVDSKIHKMGRGLIGEN